MATFFLSMKTPCKYPAKLFIIFILMNILSAISASEKPIYNPVKFDDKYIMLSLGFPVGFMNNKHIDNKFAVKIGSIRLLFRPPESKKILWGPGFSFTSFFHKEKSGLLLNIFNLNAGLQYYLNRIRKGIYLSGNIGFSQAFISSGLDLAASSSFTFSLSSGAGFMISEIKNNFGILCEIIYNYTAVKNHIHIISLNIGLLF